MTARIPFALLGVALLVGSGTLVATLGDPAVSEPDVERAMDRLSAESQSALRDAARTAGARATRHPVVARAGTEMGQVLNESTPFRDALRIRVYLRLRENLGRISTRRHGVQVVASLPAIDKPEDLRAAKRRVGVERAGADGTSMRVTVENVTLTARRGGRVVGQRHVSPTLVVPTPTLAVHDRVELFESRLEAGPLKPGLGRRLTARLYPVVWARGYAQYSGAPIENVLANRHVSLFTNGAILDIQRTVFGHSDPAGRHVLGRATADAAVTDLLAGTDGNVTDLLLKAHREVGLTSKPADALGPSGSLDLRQTPDETVTIAVNDTADRAFLDAHARLEELLRRTYTSRVWLRQRVRHLETRQLRAPDPVGGELIDTDEQTYVGVTVRSGETRDTPDGRHVLDTYHRTVRVTHEIRRRYRTEKGIETTIEVTQEVYAVRLTLVGNHTLGPAPSRPIALVHDPGGPLDGPNLADVRSRAHRRLVGDRGGVDSLAARAVREGDVTATTLVRGERPDGLRAWIYADLVALRERARNVSITTTRGEVATFRTNPPAELVATLDGRRERLADLPVTYPHVAGRARVAARWVYLDELRARLAERAETRRESERKLGETLSGSSDGDPLKRLQGAYERRDRRDGPGQLDGLEMRVDAEPAYLTRRAVDSDTVPAVASGTEEYPLVVRNWNVVSLPYGDVADAILETLLGPTKTRLRTGAQVLRTVESRNASVEKGRLEHEVGRATRFGRRAARGTLREFDLGDAESRRGAVREGLSRWETTGARGLALANGSAAETIHAAALERWEEELTPSERDLLALRLDRNLRRVTELDLVRPTQPTVNGTANRFRSRLKDELAKRLGEGLKEATKAKLEDYTGRTLARLPSGMPVAPAPGFWYATVNLWQVSVGGEYARFTVRVPRGTPDDPGAQLRYVRDGSRIGVDVDGDGTREHLGYATRVTFRTGTDVAIAVPPGPQGVGDIDGRTVEESPGWPRPGP